MSGRGSTRNPPASSSASSSASAVRGTSSADRSANHETLHARQQQIFAARLAAAAAGGDHPVLDEGQLDSEAQKRTFVAAFVAMTPHEQAGVIFDFQQDLRRVEALTRPRRMISGAADQETTPEEAKRKHQEDLLFKATMSLAIMVMGSGSPPLIC